MRYGIKQKKRHIDKYINKRHIVKSCIYLYIIDMKLLVLSFFTFFILTATDVSAMPSFVNKDTAKEFSTVIPQKAELTDIQIPVVSPASDRETFSDISVIPEGCPKLTDSYTAGIFQDTEIPAVREVSQMNTDVLPLPEDDLSRESLLISLNTTLEYWNARPDYAKIIIAGDTYKAPQMRKTLKLLISLIEKNMPVVELKKAIEKNFTIYRASADDGSGKTTLTGYYEAEIPASRVKTAKHIFPVYARPADLIKTPAEEKKDFDYGHYVNGRFIRHYSTQEIHNGALDGEKLEIAWSEHPAQLMLLQIQGSGILRYEDGSFTRVGFAGANGHPFRSVQRALMDCGEIQSMSFKNFISYLVKQPQSREARLIEINPRFIFFTIRTEPGATGAIGKILTPGRSIAVDPKYIPYGLPGLVKSRRPVYNGENAPLTFKNFTRFINSHDTGSAIRGPGRLDLFWGAGKAAEAESSAMKATGELYLFVAK